MHSIIVINTKQKKLLSSNTHWAKVVINVAVFSRVLYYMTFYELIFLWQFSMKLLGLLTTKHFFSFILGCQQDFNFAWPFHPFSPVSTQPYQNGRAKLKSCGHPRIKLKKCFVVGRPKSFIENCRRKIYS